MNRDVELGGMAWEGAGVVGEARGGLGGWGDSEAKIYVYFVSVQIKRWFVLHSESAV